MSLTCLRFRILFQQCVPLLFQITIECIKQFLLLHQLFKNVSGEGESFTKKMCIQLRFFWNNIIAHTTDITLHTIYLQSVSLIDFYIILSHIYLIPIIFSELNPFGPFQSLLSRCRGNFCFFEGLYARKPRSFKVNLIVLDKTFEIHIFS